LAGPLRQARADVSDLTGLDARARGMGMSTLTLCEDWSAAACNPGAGAMARRLDLGLGYSFTHMRLSLNGARSDVMDARGTVVGFNAPFRIRRKVGVAISMTGYLPDQFLARVQLVPASEPRFVLLDHRPHRLVLDLALSIQPAPWLSLGLGGTILADAAGNGITFNVGVKGGTKVGETAIDLMLPMRVAPLAGLLIKPLPWLRFGAAYRGEVDLGVRLDILANVDVAGIVTGDAIISIRAINYFTPHRVEVGISADPHPRLTLAAGLAWEMWSRFRGGTSDVRILVDLGLNPPMVQAFFPVDNFRDVLTPRLGAEYRHPLRGGRELALRAGYVYAPTPAPDPVGLSALVDNDRHLVTLGLGFRLASLASWFPYPVGADLGLQYHALVPRRVARNLLSDPVGGVLQSEGGLLSMALTLKAEF
jgi:long-subunit fatty acid transport protein